MLEFFSCKAETSTSCHRVLGKRAWLTLMGNKGSLHSPRSGKFRDESEKRKLENKDASFASDTHPSWDSVQRPGSREQNRALFILSAPIVPVPTAGPEPRGLTRGLGRREAAAPGAASRGFQAPPRGERPRPGPAGPGAGLSPGRARSLHHTRGPASPPREAPGFVCPAPAQPRGGPHFGAGSPRSPHLPHAGFSSGWINLPFSF